MTPERAEQLRADFKDNLDQSCQHRILELLVDHTEDTYVCVRCGTLLPFKLSS